MIRPKVIKPKVIRPKYFQKMIKPKWGGGTRLAAGLSSLAGSFFYAKSSIFWYFLAFFS